MNDYEKMLATDIENRVAARAAFNEANSNHQKALHGRMPGTDGLRDESLIESVANDLFLPALKDAEATLHRLSRVAEENARQIIRETDNPQPRLTDAEMAVAGHYRAFAEVEAKSLPLDQLAAKASAAIRSANRPEVYAWMEPIRARLAEPGNPVTQNDPDVQAARQGLNGFQSRARELLRNKSDDALRAKAAKARNAAQDDRTAAGKRAQASKRYSFQTDQDVPWERPA